MLHSGACIWQDLAAVTTTTIALIKSEKAPATSATLAGVIATENAFVFLAPSNLKENTPALSSVATPVKLGNLIASAFGITLEQMNDENLHYLSTIAKSSITEPLAHDRQFQMVSGKTILSNPSNIVIIPDKTNSAAPLASRMTINTVASEFSAYEMPYPFLPPIVGEGLQGFPVNGASESNLDRSSLSSSANGASALSVNGIIPFQGVKFIITSKSTFSLPL